MSSSFAGSELDRELAPCRRPHSPSPHSIHTQRPDVFPDGFNFIAGQPLALHNRWFGANNSYITKLGFRDSFILEAGTDFALPIKSDVFTYLMGKAKTWGMVLYEQDWCVGGGGAAAARLGWRGLITASRDRPLPTSRCALAG